MASELKLWRISQEANCDYDTYDSAVVVAVTEDEARHISPDDFRVWKGGCWHFQFADGTSEPERHHNSWADPESVKVEMVGVAASGLKAGEKICASFNAG